MRRNSAYYENLIQVVLDKSERDNWHQAVVEWVVDDCEEDDECESSCICGKENLKYLFTIRNVLNGNILYPIGSSCIKKFERGELNDIVAIHQQLFKLLHAIENNEFITLSSDLFSKKLLKYFYDEGVFKANSHNHFDPEDDYDFLLKMFRKRDKDSITTFQQKKITAIIMTSIRPYLRSILRDKIKHR